MPPLTAYGAIEANPRVERISPSVRALRCTGSESSVPTPRTSVTTACAAKAVTLRATSCLNPMITAMARIITATLNATEITAIRSITPGLLSGVCCAVRRAMKKARFTAADFAGKFMQRNTIISYFCPK